MTRNSIIGAVALALGAAGSAAAQDVMQLNEQAALKGLRRVAIVLRANTPTQVVTTRELGDMVRVSLNKSLPQLSVSDSVYETGVSWLEVSIISTDQGGTLEMSLHRWVRIRDSDSDAFVPVWSTMRASFGGMPRSSIQESVDEIITRFAATYLRANAR